VAIVRDNSPGIVEHVLWNKLSGELVVHWIHEGRQKENTISIFANFSRIVDTVSIAKEEQVSLLMFNHAHDKLSTQVLFFSIAAANLSDLNLVFYIQRASSVTL